MSLSGNLKALSLPELLQIVALARKTGSLEVCAEHGVAWLELLDGGIVRVAVDGDDLEPDVVLARRGLDATASPDEIQSALWDAAVRAIIAMFDWHEGEFSFESFDTPDAAWRGPVGIELPAPLAPEFLALEGARLEDEARSGPKLVPTAAGEIDPDLDWSDLDDAEPQALAPTAIPAGPPPVLICVDPDLPLLERMKTTLSTDATRVHIFQDAGDALTRLKQYMVKGSFPVLVMSTAVEDPLDARLALGWRRFAARLRSLAPGLRIVLIGAAADVADSGLESVAKPNPQTATQADMSDFLSRLANLLGMRA